MNKSTLIGCSILAVAIVAGTLIYVSSNRYGTASGADGRVYKVDKRTGEAVLLAGNKEIDVRPKGSDVPTTEAEQAISLAKKAFIMNEFRTNETVLNERLKNLKGTLEVQGWKAVDQGDGVHLVTYGFIHNGQPKTLYLEVNLPAGIVRNVKGDDALEKKYLGKSESE
jgi:hypothetical protein